MIKPIIPWQLRVPSFNLSSAILLFCVCFPVMGWLLLFFIWVPLLFFLASNYLLASKPNLLHGLPPKPNKAVSNLLKTPQPQLISHRCGSADYPENTIYAAKKCINNSAKTNRPPFLHVDVHLTADNTIVCFHDSEPFERNLLKLTGIDSSISSIDLNQIPPFLSFLPKNPLCHFGHVDTSNLPPEGRRMCTFDQFCTVTANVPLVVELWEESDEFVLQVYNSLCCHRRNNITIWGNRFNSVIQSSCKNVDPEMPVMSSANQWLMIYASYYCGILPFLPLNHINMFNAVLINSDHWSKLFSGPCIRGMSEINAGRFKAVLFYLFELLNFFLFAPKLFRHLKARGIPVVGLCLNDRTEWILASSESGFSAVCTDYPNKFDKHTKTTGEMFVGSGSESGSGSGSESEIGSESVLSPTNLFRQRL